MKPIGSILLASVGFMATAAQALLALAWTQTDARKQFVSVFKGVYGEVPYWTQLMFGLGQFVWLLPAVSALLLFLGLRRRALSLSIATGLVIAVLVGMVYAMYPIHVMMTVI